MAHRLPPKTRRYPRSLHDIVIEWYDEQKSCSMEEHDIDTGCRPYLIVRFEDASYCSLQLFELLQDKLLQEVQLLQF